MAVQTRTGMPLGQTVGISVSRSHPCRFAQPSPHPKSRTAPHLRPPPCHTLTARTAPRPRAPPQALATTHSSVCHRYNVLAVGTLCNCNHSACGLFRWISSLDILPPRSPELRPTPAVRPFYCCGTPGMDESVCLTIHLPRDVFVLSLRLVIRL